MLKRGREAHLTGGAQTLRLEQAMRMEHESKRLMRRTQIANTVESLRSRQT